MPSSRPRTHLLLDWDSTLTRTDTLALIARISSRLSSSSSLPSPPPNPHSPSSFAALTAAYTHSLHAHTTTYHPSSPQRLTVAAELRFLESLRPVEERSVRRVEEAGVFRGVRGKDVDGAAGEAVSGGEVVLRGGWRGCLSAVLNGEWGVGGGGGRGEGGDWGEGGDVHTRGKGRGRVGVVSVGWSARFIRGCLLRAAADDAGREMVNEMAIVANEIEGLDDEGGSAGMLSRWFGEEGGGIWTAGDKARVVRRLVAEEEGGEEGERRARTVYVGDSVTDLECLLLVDVGVCVRDEPLQSGQEALREILERVGVPCRWIGEMGRENAGLGGQGGEGVDGGREKGLWWARDFEEIRRSALFCGSTGTEIGN